ncbi:DUF1684 domain-containing protein [Microbacterium sp. GXF6406]
MNATRWDQIHAPHGIASLRHTHWLDGDPQAYEGAPGRWHTGDGAVIGTGIDGIGDIVLAPFAETVIGAVKLRAFARDGALALRVHDPENPARVQLTGIESYAPDAAWALTGRYEPAAVGEERLIRSVDGHESTHPAGGRVTLMIRGEERTLIVSDDGGALNAVIADSSASGGTYPFRFLPIGAPDAAGAVTVDFNRAYLPPCAFSDQYVCPLPPPENRLPIAVTAGERRALRADS